MIGEVNDPPAIGYRIHNTLISNFLSQRIDLADRVLQGAGHQAGAHGGLQGIKVEQTLARATGQPIEKIQVLNSQLTGFQLAACLGKRFC